MNSREHPAIAIVPLSIKSGDKRLYKSRKRKGNRKLNASPR
jgi:hypothetical protein